jgi:hypothetical protein
MSLNVVIQLALRDGVGGKRRVAFDIDSGQWELCLRFRDFDLGEFIRGFDRWTAKESGWRTRPPRPSTTSGPHQETAPAEGAEGLSLECK